VLLPAFAIGILIAWQWPLNPYLLLIVGGASLFGLILIASAKQANSLSLWGFAAILCLCLGAGRYWLATPNLASDPLIAHHGWRVIVEGTIVDEPDVRDSTINLRVRAERLIVDGETTSLVDGPTLQIRAPRDTPWQYGDILRAFGPIDAPPVMAEFSYRDYLARKGVYTWMPQPDRLELLSQNNGNPAYAQLLRAKNALRLSSQRVMPSPESALLNGILIGDDNEIPASIQAAFRATGTSHIVSISGFNVSIVIALVVPLLGRLFNKRRAALIAIPAIVIYMLLTGASASVVRASVMAILSLIGQLFWRRGFTLNTLCAAGFLMLAQDPNTLFDGGFQLSFMATLGLVLYADRLTQAMQRGLTRITSQARAERLSGFLADLFLVTLAAQITTLPILLVNFQQLSLISLVANAIVLPLQPAAMILGMLGSGVGLFSIGLGRIAALPTYALLTATLRLVELFAQVPWASIPIHSFGLPGAMGYYAGVGSLTWLWSLPTQTRAILQRLVRSQLRASTVLMSLLIAAIVGGVYWYQQPDGQLHVITAGNGIFIQTPQGRQIVIGGGNGVLAVMGRSMPLWDQQVDLLVLTEHDDRARDAALPILQRYQVAALLSPVSDVADEPTPMLARWQSALAQSQPITLVHQVGTPIQVEPDLQLQVTEQSDGSLCLRLIYAQERFEFLGSRSATAQNLSRDSIVFLNPKPRLPQPIGLLKKIGPRWLIWADTAPAPSLTNSAISNHSVSMREVGQLEFVTSGAKTTVMQR